MSLMASTLLLAWAVLIPRHSHPQWWHLLVAVAIVVAFVGSWHGQHLSTIVTRWVPMALRTRRARRPVAGTGRPPEPQRHSMPDVASGSPSETATIVVHLSPQPHSLTTAATNGDQLPWAFITAWLDRYSIRVDDLTVCAVTRTPPNSSLRNDVAPLLTPQTPQRRDTWLTMTLSAPSNVAAIAAGRRGRRGFDDHEDAALQARTSIAELADVTARRFSSELREQGWKATLCDDPAQLPRFVTAGGHLRRECWTGAEYADGFRAVYAIDPESLKSVLDALPMVTAKTTWVSLSVRSRGSQGAAVSAAVGVLTAARPGRHLLPGLTGFHGLHHTAADALSVGGHPNLDLPTAPLSDVGLDTVPWRTTESGIPLGSDPQRRPNYLALASAESVRITVTGTTQFHLRIVGRLALSGLPVAVYTNRPAQWERLANYAAPQQIGIAVGQPGAELPAPPDGAIVVADGSVEPPSGGAILVTLRTPQSGPPPSTAVVITQVPNDPEWFHVITPQLRESAPMRLGRLLEAFRTRTQREPGPAQLRDIEQQARGVWLNVRV